MRPAHDLSNLIKWLSREEWQPLLEEVMDDHFGPAMKALDLEFEEIDAALGGTWAMTLWGCAFEDFLTRRFEPDGRNPVEAYLQRRGWKESAAARRYMTALQSSVMSLYEVSDITPGQSLRARDLIRGGDPVLVSERSATQSRRPSRLHPGRIGTPHHRSPGRFGPRGRAPAASEGQAGSRDTLKMVWHR